MTITPLWTPSKASIATSQMTAFIQFVNNKQQQNIASYETLHQWSIKNLEACWDSIWQFNEVIASKRAMTILRNPNDMEQSEWFGEARLNFAENLLRRRDDHTALIFVGENKRYRKLSYKKLFHQVAVLAKYFRDNGIKTGDRIAAFMPNIPETVVQKIKIRRA